jgi:hypothetical protein
MTIELDDSSAQVPLSPAAGEAHLKEAVAHELHVAFPSVPVDQVTILVECLWTHFEDAPVRDFVPLLVGKQAREELLDHLGPRAEPMVPSRGAPPTRPRSVFLPPGSSTP